MLARITKRFGGALPSARQSWVHVSNAARGVVSPIRSSNKGSGASGPLLSMVNGGGSGTGGRGGRIVRTATGGSGGEGAKGNGLWKSYLDFLEAQPMLSRCITCGLLNGLGDIFSQLFVEKQEFNSKRCLTFTLLGLLYVGPILTTWYNLLGSMVTATGLAGVAISLAWDQLFFAPAFIASFMAVLTCIDGHPEQVKAKLKQDWPEAVKVNWILWIPAQFINFKFVPPNLRVLAVNIVALLWNVYMSYQGHKKVEAPAPPAPPPATNKRSKK